MLTKETQSEGYKIFMVERYRKGKRMYTNWDNKTEQVTVSSRKKTHDGSAPPSPDAPVDMPPSGYADGSVIAHTPGEFVINFIAAPQGKGRVISRVIMSSGTARCLAVLLEKTLT